MWLFDVWIVLFLASHVYGYFLSSNGVDDDNIYINFLDKTVEVLSAVVERTEQLSPADNDRVSCINVLKAFRRNLTAPWALSMLDSSSKIPSGLLTGNILSLGLYDECIRVTVGPSEVSSNIPPFTGQHCLITAQVYFPNASMNMNGDMISLPELFGTPYLPITMGQCYPSLCKPWVLEEAVNHVLKVPDYVLHLLGTDYYVNATVASIDCHVKGGEPYDALDRAVLGAIIFFVVLGIVSSVVDYYINTTTVQKCNSYPMKLLLSFSLYSNSQKLFSPTMASEDAIPSLNGLKFISICWLILGHRYLYLNREPLTNLLDLKYLDDLDIMFIFNALLSYETFFVISGMLNMYGFASMMAKTNRCTIKDLISRYIYRYLRLTPVYLLMIAFTATWQYRLRDGPLWGRLVGEYKDSCRESYWMNLVYLNNYLKPDGFCMMQSWYLAVEMQLFSLSPLLVYPLWRWPKVGFVQVVVLTIAAIASPFMVSWYNHIKAPLPITSDRRRQATEMALLNYPTHTKSVSYILGIAAGYLLYKYKKGEITVKFNTWMRTLGWTMAATLMAYAIFGGYYTFLMDTEYNRLFSAYFIGFQRFFWALGLIWIIWVCAIGYGGFVNDFLSWNVFVPLGRITYCMFLTFVPILMCSIAAQRTPFYYKDYQQMEMYFGDLIMCVFSGLLLTLFVEAPLLNVERLIMGTGETTEKGEAKRVQTTRQAVENNCHVI